MPTYKCVAAKDLRDGQIILKHGSHWRVTHSWQPRPTEVKMTMIRVADGVREDAMVMPDVVVALLVERAV